MPARLNSRKTKVVNVQVQWTLAARVMLHFFVFVCVGAALGLINQFLSNPLASATDHLAAFWRQSKPLLLALLCLVPIFVRDTLKLTNRIAGPIYNLHRTCEQLAAGDPNVRPLQFRNGDMWADLPEKFNGMVEKLKSSDNSPPRYADTVAEENKNLVSVSS